ncbi:MAG: hypothetical protein MUF64_17290 [Polyangiaceae bacterium]|nr:hypothetical protein [Polyangiaceae bacterium]
MMLRSLPGSLLSLALLSACAPSSAPDPATSTPATPSAPASAAPRPSAPAASVVPSTLPPPPPAPPASTPAPAASAAEAPTPPRVEEKPLPRVKVANIGIHIGGGPNDNATKEPFKRSVQPHYDEMRRCWSMVEGQKGDISVELRVEREGGKARVKPNKSTFKHREFNECVHRVFEGIDFLKPRTGTTVLNFSLRFTPEG